MIGAYYETKALQPFNGIGALGAPMTMNDEATQAMASLFATLSPPTTVIPWAVLDESTGQWSSGAPSYRYQLYLVNAAALDTAQRMAFGQPVGFVCVLDAVAHARPSDLFDGTPWEYFETDAVYDESDAGDPPRIKFLYWGKLRDEGAVQGTASTLEAQVKTIGGQLVYPLNLSVTGMRPLPATSFDVALQRQFGVPPSTSAASSVPLSPSQSTAPSSSAPSVGVGTSSGWGKLVLLASVAGVAGYVAFRVVRRR